MQFTEKRSSFYQHIRHDTPVVLLLSLSVCLSLSLSLQNSNSNFHKANSKISKGILHKGSVC
jgi:hypothetical protein